MSTAEVRLSLQRVNLPTQMTPDGWELPGGYRLHRGGGIAGNLGAWWLSSKSGGDVRGPFRSRRALETALKEWQAGDRPALPGKWHAVFRTNRFGSNYVWERYGSAALSGAGMRGLSQESMDRVSLEDEIESAAEAAQLCARCDHARFSHEPACLGSCPCNAFVESERQ